MLKRPVKTRRGSLRKKDSPTDKMTDVQIDTKKNGKRKRIIEQII